MIVLLNSRSIEHSIWSKHIRNDLNCHYEAVSVDFAFLQQSLIHPGEVRSFNIIIDILIKITLKYHGANKDGQNVS